VFSPWTLFPPSPNPTLFRFFLFYFIFPLHPSTPATKLTRRALPSFLLAKEWENHVFHFGLKIPRSLRPLPPPFFTWRSFINICSAVSSHSCTKLYPPLSYLEVVFALPLFPPLFSPGSSLFSFPLLASIPVVFPVYPVANHPLLPVLEGLRL